MAIVWVSFNTYFCNLFFFIIIFCKKGVKFAIDDINYGTKGEWCLLI